MKRNIRQVIILLVLTCLVANLAYGCGNNSTDKDAKNAEPYLIGGSDASTKPDDKNDPISKQFSKKNFDLKNLDDSIAYAIIKTNCKSSRSTGECFGEGHKILDKYTKDGQTVVCMLVIEGYMGFENDVLTCVSGSCIPSQLVFTKNKDGEYELKSYKTPMDGTYYPASLKKIFTKKALLKLDNTDPDELAPQFEEYGKKYLKSIGREAMVQWNTVIKETPNIKSADVSNKLFSQFEDYPYWIGTQERIEDGKRIVYCHKWESDGKGGGTSTFRKEIYNGKILEESVVTVKGDKYTVVKTK